MTKRSKKHPPADADRDAALQLARANQQPGQTKEQTRLIAKGIQKGIEQYRKQQNAKARELDKQRKKARQQPASPDTGEPEVREQTVYRQQWLPWVLLALSWMGMGAWCLFTVKGS